MHLELRVTRKKLGWLFLLKAAWIVAASIVLLVGLGSCLAGDTPCFEAGQLMEGFMLLLSFPSCILFFLWAPLIYGAETIHYPADYVFFWLGTFVVGYLQWFVLIPRVFADPLITSLGLAHKVLPKSDSKRHTKRHLRHLSVHEPKPFDEAGRTPLERAFIALDQ
jgi:hypothetical protein